MSIFITEVKAIDDKNMYVDVGFLSTDIINILCDKGIKEAKYISYKTSEKALRKAIKSNDFDKYIASLIRSYKRKNSNNKKLNSFLRNEFKIGLELGINELKEMGYKFY